MRRELTDEQRQHIAPHLPPKRRTGWPIQTDPLRCAQRWIVERSTAWLQSFRPVLVRHERLLTTYRAFVLLACVMITLGALLR